MKLSNEPYELSDDDLYGGVFDISMGSNAQIDMETVRAALLFYDSIVIPDGFFTANGPLSQILKREISSSSESEPAGETLSYLRNGLLVPAIRLGEHIADVWFNGESAGVRPGVFLSQSKEDGDRLFSSLQNVEMKYALWPKDMADATTNSFGSLCKKHMFDPDLGLPEPSKIEALLNVHLPDASFSIQKKTAVNLIATVQQSVFDNATNPRYRRGELETIIGNCLGWPKFRYEKIWIGDDLGVWTARAIVQLISSVYEINQSINFGTSLFLVDHKDPISVMSEKGYLQQRKSRLATHAVNIMSDIDFSKIHARHIVSLRKDRDVADLFDLAKILRRSALKSGSPEDLAALLDFIKNKYTPAILKIAPDARNTIESSKLRAQLSFVGNAATITGVISLVAGKCSLGFLSADYLTKTKDIIQAIGEWATLIGASGVVSSAAPFDWTDRFIIGDKKRQNAIRKLQNDISIGEFD